MSGNNHFDTGGEVGLQRLQVVQNLDRRSRQRTVSCRDIRGPTRRHILQQMAPPNAVLVAETTRRLVGDLFEYNDLGAVALKGLPGPVPAWQVLGESTVENRFAALRSVHRYRCPERPSRSEQDRDRPAMFQYPSGPPSSGYGTSTREVDSGPE